jgi:uncharacterized protein (DUF433 family)
MIETDMLMNIQTDTLTPAEAAVVSRVTIRDVHRVIDEQILPQNFYNAAQTRSFTSQACVFISFYFRAADRLTSEERQRTIRIASEPPQGGSGKRVVQDAFLTIDLDPFWKDVEESLKRLQRAREMVVSDPEILGGTPVLRGTRVPVYDVAASVAAGIPTKRILSAYPSLKPEQVELATMYSEANPQRGRPRLRSSMLPATTALTQRKKRRIPATA